MRIGIFSLVIFFSFSTTLVAEEEGLSLKQMLLSPGDLTKAHAEIESKCQSCHVHFEKSNQSPLCLECHEKIDEDLTDKNGFHGKLSKLQIADCKSCHTDHQGRDFDITGLDRDNFDHSITNFKLDGSHKNISCSDCHTNLTATIKMPAKGILKLPVDEGFRFKMFKCSSCHEDFHKEELGNQCENCHNTKAWTDNGFEHDKTDFPLDGEHQNLACDSCHVNNQFKDTETQCVSCHLAKDPHLGIFGKKCNDCHTPKEWPNKTYKHFKETGYHLKDSHVQVRGKKVKCIDCHSELLNPETDCVACHQADDVHQKSNGNKCQDCHNQKTWEKSDFVHDELTTGFALLGSHKTVSCDSCHIPGEKRNNSLSSGDLGLVRECIDCHQAIDPHFAKLGKDCGSCHQTDDWNSSVKFNHDFTEFPLTASHQLLVCESCHLSADFSELTQNCVSCHKDDDHHDGTLGEKCQLCHDSSVWSHWIFDHQEQTKFPLDGSHQSLKCVLCHNNEIPDALKPDKDCYSCHRDDDIHNGGFGVDCEQCHSEDRFDELVF